MEIIEGKVFINGRLRKASIGIEDGKIVKIKKILYGKVHNYGNLVILPSGIDIHVHFRQPGYEHKEDFFTGSKAAALAGITFIADMPNNKPAIMTNESFRKKIEMVKGKAWVDYGIYAGVGEKLVKDARLYKLYLSGDNESYVDYDKLPSLLRKIKEKDAFLAIHAEDRNCIKRQGKNLEEYNKNNPIKCEEMAVKKLLEINEKIKAKIHICHVTSAKIAKELNKKGTSFGITLHHILFSYESRFKKEAIGKVNPPLRNEEERKKLFKMVMKGKPPIMESDHAPHTIEEKNDFPSSPAGMPGIDALLPIMLYFVKIGKISLKNLMKMVAENPARLIGVNKGSISIGNDADFIIVDFKKLDKIKPLSKCGWSPYEGMNAIYPAHVWMRGNVIVEDGIPVGKPMGERKK